MHRLLALLLVVVAACGGSGSSAPAVAPDFLLQDVNPNSPTSAMSVSPRDYIGNVSGYYFGAAT